MSTKITVARPAANQGYAWVQQGWAWFRTAPVPWMGMTAMALLALTGIALLPMAGNPIVEFLSPFLFAGYMSASRAAERGEPVTFLHLPAGFQSEARIQLAIMGIIYMAGSLIVGVITNHVAGADLAQMPPLPDDPQLITPEQAQAVLNQAFAMLLGLLLMTPLIMATWFSPALALFDGFSATNALWWSLWACLVNWRPILMYSLWLGLIMIAVSLMAFIFPPHIAQIILSLSLLVLLPLAMTSSYAAYRAMFVPAQPAADLA